MPTLNWIGKEAVVNHDKEVPFKLLRKVKSASVGENSQNLIMHGDNLEALKALMPFYVGKIKCIYIDPPYNTGNGGWIYNDQVNSQKIKNWFTKQTRIDANDLCRHDKWLCMMYPRLKLLKDLLKEDGVIFISIDHNEEHHLKILLDEIFGEDNFVETIVWRKKEGGGQQDDFLVTEHEFVLMYAKDKLKFSIIDKKIKRLSSEYPLKDKSGNRYKLMKLAKWGSGALKEDRPTMHFPIKDPNGGDNFPISPDGKPGRWRYGKAKMDELVLASLVEFKKNGEWIAYEKINKPKEDQYKIVKERSIFYSIGGTADGTNELTKLFNEKDKFPHPKPVNLIKKLFSISSNNGDIFLDSFAGSGTTGHAVLDLNKEDGGNRKFILVEMEDKVAKDITAERVKRAIEKYDYKDGFEYCELDKPLFNEKGNIEDSCDFNQFATYIYFTETQTNIDKKKIKGNFVGDYSNVDYYLIYKGKNKNVLDKAFLKKIRKSDNKKVIYADWCSIDDDILKKYNIEFKQIPYEVKVY